MLICLQKHNFKLHYCQGNRMFAAEELSRATPPNAEHEHQNEAVNITLAVEKSNLSQVRNATVEDFCLQSRSSLAN